MHLNIKMTGHPLLSYGVPYAVPVFHALPVSHRAPEWGDMAGFCLPLPTTRLLRRVCKDRLARGGVWCCNDGGVGYLGEEKDRQKRRRWRKL